MLMERAVNNNNSGHQNRPKAKGKRQQQPMKVVHITNPMRFKASASEFRALVQELTGKDSDVADNMAKYYQPPTDDTRSATLSATSDTTTDQGGEAFDEAFQNFPWFLTSFHDVHDTTTAAFQKRNRA